jgi:hypothetical protein
MLPLFRLRRPLERFWPPYLFFGKRPVNRAAPRQVRYRVSFDVLVDDAAMIESVALIRSGSVTHSINTDQRFVELEILERIIAPKRIRGVATRLQAYFFISDRLVLRAPPHGYVAPPGYYMLFLVSKHGVPSVARFVQLVPQYDLSASWQRFMSQAISSMARFLQRRV